MSVRGRHLTEAGLGLQQGGGWLARLIAGGMERIVQRVDAGLQTGSIEARLPDGSTRYLGGRAPGFDAKIHLREARALWRLATGGSVGWFRAWQRGEWDSPDPVQVFAVFAANAATLGKVGRAKGPWRWFTRAFHAMHANTRKGAKANIAAHYDLGNDFYRAWLDPTMSYSSAMWTGADTLEQAQRFKIGTLIERMAIAPGDRVLEIGCGWGFLSGTLAGPYEAAVTAISLSDEQLEHARAHHAAPDFRHQDYREVSGTFDAIVSVEMVEALGREYWPAFMDVVAGRLRPGGRAAIQFISMRDDLFEAYAASADFIQTHVFPGGLLIKRSEFRALAEARGLSWQDEQRFGADYAKTLRAWRQNFERAMFDDKMPEGFDVRFIDLWRFYLMYCEGGFLGGAIDVHQVTLVRT